MNGKAVIPLVLLFCAGFMSSVVALPNDPPKKCENWGCTWFVGGSDSSVGVPPGCFPTQDDTGAEEGKCKCEWDETAEEWKCKFSEHCDATVKWTFERDGGNSLCTSPISGGVTADCVNYGGAAGNFITIELSVTECGGKQEALYYQKSGVCPNPPDPTACGASGAVCKSRRSLECRTCNCPECLCPGDPGYPY